MNIAAGDPSTEMQAVQVITMESAGHGEARFLLVPAILRGQLVNSDLEAAAEAGVPRLAVHDSKLTGSLWPVVVKDHVTAWRFAGYGSG